MIGNRMCPQDSFDSQHYSTLTNLKVDDKSLGKGADVNSIFHPGLQMLGEGVDINSNIPPQHVHRPSDSPSDHRRYQHSSKGISSNKISDSSEGPLDSEPDHPLKPLRQGLPLKGRGLMSMVR
ncbi:hypothetical protein FRX31_021210 [Thalictrum thalictroides]|uniref:Uncharacterized protein n=1 Tax=Thalictrum thalictroides TaxID=46969 RepID=A0A7J6VXZ9_THATH|nr:hypothetical protein FRX31_021210 [Thalictrum thalictroides]